ncbi:hypothetical protein [Oligoflexus tunisiensis]|uniref:hypothetical protein n=1 Tax=Oligoflexus tunisiensis TaxID=708132 RepID=UPI00114CBDC1|nr:hypothetical protein [Oligoflexus tunisiensis]
MEPRFGTVISRPATDPLRQRLQFWLEQLDRFLREKDPIGMQGVPQPRIFLLEHAQPQAFVGRMDVCLRKMGQLQGAEGTSEDFLGLDRERGGLFSVPGPRPCVPLPYQGVALQRFMDWYVKPFAGCTTRVTKRTVDFAPGCLQASIDGSHAPAQTREIFVRMSGHWLVMTTGLMQNLTEYEAVATVFHEAAHYYRAHRSQPDALHDFLAPHAADKEMAELAQELMYWRKAKENGYRTLANGAPGQRYHSGLYFIARHVIQDWIRKEGQRSACKDLSQHFLTAPGLTHFPLEKPDERGYVSYQDYERKVDACLVDLPLNATLQKRMVDNMERLAPWSPRVLGPVPELTTVRELWDWLNRALPAVVAAPDTRLAELSRRADALGLGPYTREQEANELVVDWLTKFGIDPQHGVKAALKLLKLETQSPLAAEPRPGAYTYEQCVEAYEAKFRAADGSEWRVPVGDYSDPHQSSCYRAFNMYRNINTQGYALKRKPERVAPPDPAWDTMAR